MEQQEIITIEFYEKGGGKNITSELPTEHLPNFLKINEDFQNFSLDYLLKAKRFVPIRNKNYKGYKFFELRYFLPPRYTGIAIVSGLIATIIVIFKGSGSGGNTNKYLPLAKKRADCL